MRKFLIALGIIVLLQAVIGYCLGVWLFFAPLIAKSAWFYIASCIISLLPIPIAAWLIAIFK